MSLLWFLSAILWRAALIVSASTGARRLGMSRLAELQAGATEAWFEERRALEASPRLAATPSLRDGLSLIGAGVLIALFLLLR